MGLGCLQPPEKLSTLQFDNYSKKNHEIERNLVRVVIYTCSFFRCARLLRENAQRSQKFSPTETTK